MSWQFSRRFFLGNLLFFAVNGCQSEQTYKGELRVGVINYGGGGEILEQYAGFKDYLGEKTKARVILEPTYNENKAIERLESRAWSLVFAPPGLAAIAISRYKYIPIFPLVGVSTSRCVLVTRDDSTISDLKGLQGKKVALGQLGSATGYYLPLFNLYGLTLAEVLSASTPKIVMDWVAEGKVDAGAVSMAEFNLYRSTSPTTKLRILYTDPHFVPPGAVLIESGIERKLQDYIRKVMNEFPSTSAQKAGYIPNAPIPNYQYMIGVVARVQSIVTNLQTKPVQLFNKQGEMSK